MTEQMTVDHSEALNALAKALAAAQAEMADARKESLNPHLKNRYASLASVRAAVTPALTRHGIAAVQTFEPHGLEGVLIVTMLIHESGQWLRSRLFMPLAKKDPQGVGSAITYGRRYSLSAITGVASDDDDDGEAAVGKRPAPESGAKQVQEASVTAEAAFARALEDAASTDALAKVEAEVSKAVQAGLLTESSRARLRLSRAEAIKRLSNGTAA